MSKGIKDIGDYKRPDCTDENDEKAMTLTGTGSNLGIRVTAEEFM